VRWTLYQDEPDGRTMRKMAPADSPSDAQIRPPWAAVIEREIEVRSRERAGSRVISGWHNGSGEITIELDERDVHISVHGLLTAILPAMLPSRTVAAIFASRGGQATSRMKRTSSKVNGRKGGRPRKKRTAADAT
jgi:hypothetical protein